MKRCLILRSREKARAFFKNQQTLGKQSAIYKSSKCILRTNDFSIKYDKAIECLNNIDFIYDPINQHWAETDGISISLNTYKTFTEELLTNTLIHEALHGIIYRNSRHEIYEEKEHKIMNRINPRLI